MAIKPAYRYEAIKEPSTIRLLYLHPGTTSEDIQFSLSTVSLDDNPVYEAISYCWGDASIVKTAICENASLSTTVSLHSALVAFRLPDRPRVLWADAICIDQINTDEKSGQLLLMRRIYSQAERVLIWLGPDDHDLNDLDSVVSQAVDYLPRSACDVADLGRQAQILHDDMVERQENGQPSLLTHDWQPLLNLLQRPWFRRKWVVQETALACEAIIFAGRFRLPWNDLGQLLLLVGTSGIIERAILWGEAQKEAKGETSLTGASLHRRIIEMIGPIHNSSMISGIQLWRETAGMFDCMVATVNFLCTDDRDHVYALLSLPKKQLGLVPDYSLDAGRTFRRFAEMEITETNSLKLLGLAPDKLAFSRPGVTKRLNIPSWVPDLRRLGEVDTLVSYNIKVQVFHAGGLSWPTVKFLEDGAILECDGRGFDTVKTVLPTYLERVLAELPESQNFPLRQMPICESPAQAAKFLGDWALDCHELAGRPLEAVPADLERTRAFSRTMVCGMASMRDALTLEAIDAFPHLMRTLAAAAGRSNFGAAGPEHHPDLLPSTVTLESPLQAFGAVRRFCVTDAGRLAQIPFDAKIGDHLWVLVGAEVPFVVRPTGRGRYSLIGECYVDGVMNGEIFQSSGLTTQKIQIE
jgi:hypothetical protein